MTLFRLAFRSHRTGTIATAAVGGIAGILNAVAYVQVAGPTPAERVAFARSMEVVGRQLSYLLPQPVQLDTLGGYLTWRAFSVVAIVYAVWAMLAATGAGRGDEEKGLTETWLAAGVSRARWLGTRTAAFVVAAAISLAVTLAATALGGAIANDPLPLPAVSAEMLPLFALTLWGFGAGLLVAQLVTTRRVASVTGGVVIVALFTLNSSLRAGADPGALKWLSPFYLFDRSGPLLAGGAVDGPAVAASLAVAAALVALSIRAFARRDIGGALLRGRAASGRPRFRPAADPLLRMPVLAAVDQQRGWILGWAIGMATLAYFLSSFARTIVDGFKDIPAMRIYLQRAGIDGYADVVGVIWFSTALLLVAIFVVVQVSSWAADDAEGRLELVLAAGASRTRVVLERIAALLVATGAVAAVSSAGVYVASRVFDIPVPGDRLIVATALVLPVAFALGSIGHAIVGWRPRLAVLFVAAIAVVSYFTLEFAPLFDWPEWVGRTSLFVLYGMPMTAVDWSGAVTLVAIGTGGTALALVSMARRDVGR
ncbi:MAG: polyether ionophore transport system permease protein [Chloroflexota bacterium]|nr:polyether ionophore transport system permease protein [Chloroflexota bacterium]